ncbi:MAG: hypothetical protein LLG04_12935, partial [Parachlamydia sp.]|nr:hypothetical protein [Parachlamydia sp.]
QLSEMGVTGSRFYVDQKTQQVVLFKSNWEHAGRYEEVGINELKLRTIKILQSTDDIKIKYRAVKALFKLLNSGQLTESQKLELMQVSPHASLGLSPEKAGFAETQLMKAKGCKLSEQGGTGVYFLKLDPQKSGDPHIECRFGIIKYVPNPRQILFANRILIKLGFKVPNTKMLMPDSSTATRSLELCKTAAPDKPLPTNRQFVIMDFMNAAPLNRIDHHELILLLSDKRILYQLGKMVMVDLCIGNIDRWNIGRCALGNMMIARGFGEQAPQLILIDHECRLEKFEVDNIKDQILRVLQERGVKELFSVMAQALQPGDKSKQNPELKITLDSAGIHAFQLGLKDSIKQLKELFSHKDAIEMFNRKHIVATDQVDTNKLWQVIEFLNTIDLKKGSLLK